MIIIIYTLKDRSNDKGNVELLLQVRREPEVQELRKWQAEWREELHGNIQRQVSDFWEKKMPEQEEVVEDPDSNAKINSE